jgi:cytochrome c-type biogenesis protein CcmH
VTLWFFIAAMTAAVLFALLRPLAAAKRDTRAGEAFDAEVYRDQLREIEADRERGLIGEDEAEAARVEIARRLLATEHAAADRQQVVRRIPAGVALGLIALGIPALSIGAYLMYGSPSIPDQPLHARLQAPIGDQTVESLVARVEARLRENPEDGLGWEVIAPVYMAWQRYADAADAYSRAIRLLGEDARRLTGYGEALVLANGGVVSEQARRAFERALTLDDDRLSARLWIATAKEQDGRYSEAVQDWGELLARSDEDAPWRELVEQRLVLAEAMASGSPAIGLEADGDPSEMDVAAVQDMSPAEREDMIENMVQGLASRLEENGKDLPGWLKLVRAYSVLSRQDDAREALARARAQFNDEPQALDQLNSLAKELGLAS